MSGIPLTLIIGIGIGACLGLLVGFPLAGAAIGATTAVVLAAVADVLFSSAGSEI